MKTILKYLKGKRLHYFGAIIAVTLTSGIEMLQPLIIKETIDSVIGTQPFDGKMESYFYLLGGREYLLSNLWVLAIVLLIITGIQNVFRYFQGVWSAEASEHFAKRLKDSIYDHIQHLPYEYHVKAETGDLIQRSTSDVETIRKFLGKQFISIGRIITMGILVIVAMYNLNPMLTLLSSILIPFIIGFSVYFFTQVREVFKKSDEAEADMTSALQENLTGIRVVRAFAKQDFEINKFDEKNKKFKDSRIRLIKILAIFWSLSDILCFSQIAIVFISGMYMTLNGDITLGTLVAFIFYIEKLIWPVRELGRILTDAGQGSVSLRRINEIFNLETEDLEKEGTKQEIRGSISFKNVSFSYVPGIEILKDITFHVNEGETVAILGATGSGKSTLMHLLVRLFELKKGSILVDGIDIKNINKKRLRRSIGIVLQESFLFSKTIKENIGIVDENASIKNIYEAANYACIHKVIEEFDKGYETMVGEQGVTLSGGQKQRIAIARTIINKSKVLIFDDSLSAVDSKTDAKIREAIEGRKERVTTFLISHRISTLSKADKIIVLDSGRVQNIGTHEELIKVKGLYRTIYEIETSNKSIISA